LSVRFFHRETGKLSENPNVSQVVPFYGYGHNNWGCPFVFLAQGLSGKVFLQLCSICGCKVGQGNSGHATNVQCRFGVLWPLCENGLPKQSWTSAAFPKPFLNVPSMLFCPRLSVIVIKVASSFCHVHAQCLLPLTFIPVSSLPIAYRVLSPATVVLSYRMPVVLLLQVYLKYNESPLRLAGHGRHRKRFLSSF
jgi:hypothetical protein